MQRRVWWLAVLPALLGGAPQPPAEAPRPADVVLAPRHYELAVRVDYDTETIHGEARLVLSNPSPRPVSRVSLLLYRLMSVQSVTDAAGRPLEFSQRVVGFADFGKLQVNQLVVALREPLPAGGDTTLRIEYGGYLLGYAETGMLYLRDRVDRAFTILRHDSWAYPIPGVPSLALLRASPPANFTYRARITVPTGLTVANGGRLLAAREEGDEVSFLYESIKPSWRMDFAIAEYSVLSEGPIRVYALAGDEAGAAGVARAARTALDLFRGWFGPLRGEGGLTFIEIPDGWGSQADVTAIIQTAAAFKDPARYIEVYHEVSHLWNVPSTDRPPPRWNEGLATFLQHLVEQEATGRPVLEEKLDEVRRWLLQNLPQHPQWRQVPPVEYGRAGLTDLSYRVGALMFYLLYRLAGPDAFNRTIREYYERFAERGGGTDEFVAIASRVAPIDLTGLFEEWLYTPRWTDRILGSGSLEDLLRHGPQGGNRDTASRRPPPTSGPRPPQCCSCPGGGGI